MKDFGKPHQSLALCSTLTEARSQKEAESSASSNTRTRPEPTEPMDDEAVIRYWMRVARKIPSRIDKILTEPAVKGFLQQTCRQLVDESAEARETAKEALNERLRKLGEIEAANSRYLGTILQYFGVQKEVEEIQCNGRRVRNMIAQIDDVLVFELLGRQTFLEAYENKEMEFLKY